MPEYGARIYKREDSIQIIQTIKKGSEQNAPYVVEKSSGRNKETFVRQDDDVALAKAVRSALAGELVS